MMVSPSTELPRKCGRWEVCGIFSCPPSMEISGKHARWGDGCPTFHRIAAEVWQVGRLGYFILPTFHGNRRKACRVGRWMSHLPQNCRGSVAGGASVVSCLAHLPWKSAESMPGGAMMVSPSTELPRKCGRWVFRRSWKACLVGDLWYYSCPVYHHVESWNYSMRVIYSCPVYHHVESRSYSRRVIFTVMSRGVNKQKNRSRDSGTCFHYFM